MQFHRSRAEKTVSFDKATSRWIHCGEICKGAIAKRFPKAGFCEAGASLAVRSHAGAWEREPYIFPRLLIASLLISP